MIVENKYFKDIKRIWKDNHSGFITEESNEMLINNDDILDENLYISYKVEGVAEDNQSISD